MNQKSVTSMQRVLTTLGHREPDRVPVFFLFTLHGAKEVGLPIKTYFSDPDNVVEGQMRLLAKYRHDCIYSFFYASLEIAAFGGEVIFMDDGPPNSGEPVIKKTGDIKNLAVPDVKNTPCLEIEMCRWSSKDAENHVKKVIAKAGTGGGFILSDNHGEIPFQVRDDVLMAISEAVHTWGRYPLNWTADKQTGQQTNHS